MVKILPLIINDPSLFFLAFEDSSNYTNYDWYHHHLHVLQIFFFNSLERSEYFSIFLLFLIFVLWSAGTAKFTTWQIVLLLIYTMFGPQPGIQCPVCVSENFMRLILQDGFHLMPKPFVRRVKFKLFTQFSVNHFLQSVFHFLVFLLVSVFCICFLSS